MSKFKIGDKVRLVEGLTTNNTGILQEELNALYDETLTIENITENIDSGIDIYADGYYFEENQLEKVEDKMKIRIKYFDGATKLQKITKGNWIDVYANKDMFIEEGTRAMIPLGFALELPKGWEGHLAPRSSTFKTWGIIQTNSVGVVDDTYIGDNDQWHFPAYCLQGQGEYQIDLIEDGKVKTNTHIDISSDGTVHYENNLDKKYYPTKKGTWIHKGDKIGQFRIMEVMPELEFEEVESFGNEDRGGFGSTSSREYKEE